MSSLTHTNKTKPTALFLLGKQAYERIYSSEDWYTLNTLAHVHPVVLDAVSWREYPEECRRTEVIFSGWGMPTVDADFLSAFPNLKAIFYGAGSVKKFVTDQLWERGIIVSSAYAANAIPVSEFTVAQIVLSAKRTWQLASRVRASRSFPPNAERESPGMFGNTTIGLISLGTIGRMVAERLHCFNVRLVAYDPMASAAMASEQNVQLCSLEELFQISDIVSCHTPLLPTTEGMVVEEHFTSMKENATFINTARGAIIDQSGMLRALQKRPDLWALLDVCSPIPPAPDSLLFDLPNVFLTPHIAGSMGQECHRLGQTMIEEFRRYLAGSPLHYSICRQQALVMA